MRIFKSMTIVALLLLSACALRRVTYDRVRPTPEFKILPAGTSWLRDSLFMDRTEVRNSDWLECLYWASFRDTAFYRRMLPDTLCWREALVTNEPYARYYLRHPAYRDYPVVGISYEQALLFCQWRSDRANELLAWQKREIKTWPDTSHGWKQRISYRLPTKEEWEYAAHAGLWPEQYPHGYESLTDRNNLPASNTKEYNALWTSGYGFTVSTSRPHRRSVFPWPAKPNKYGLYHINGNVSELTADSTIVKGANFLTTIDGQGSCGSEELTPLRDTTGHFPAFRYRGPRAWIGFRCVAVVLEPDNRKK